MKNLVKTNNVSKKMTFAKTYEIFPQPVGKLPWRANRMLIEKIKDKEAREWYINKAIENNWSSVVLDHQIASALYERVGKSEE